MSVKLLASSAFFAQPLQPLSYYKEEQRKVAAQIVPEGSRPVKIAILEEKREKSLLKDDSRLLEF